MFIMAGRALAGLPERKTFQFGEFMIEASAGDEAYVEALALKLVSYQRPKTEPPLALKVGLDDLAKRRDYFLGKVAEYLALPKPTGSMAATYDTFGTIWRNMQAVVPDKIPRHYALWHSEELLGRIEAGEKIAGFSKDGSGGLNFSFSFGLNSGVGDLEEKNAQTHLNNYWNSFVCPVNIGAQPGQTPAENMSAGLEFIANQVFKGFREAAFTLQRQNVFNVLHETTENGIISLYLSSKDRRWFCDGVANYVAWKIIEREIGAEEAKGYYDLTAELKKYEKDATRVDLVAWPAAENMDQAKYAEDLNTANYAFATKVIAEACAKQGDGLLPELFTEIGRTRREKATMDTVFKAYRRLTGENLHSYLPKSAAPTVKAGG